MDDPAESSRDRPDDGVRALLESKRADLLDRIARFAAIDPAETSNQSFGKRIGDGTAYAVERMTGAYQARTLYATVSEIERAVARLDNGTYGRCLSCAGAIPAERLSALPWAALCVPCSGSRRRPG